MSVSCSRRDASIASLSIISALGDASMSAANMSCCSASWYSPSWMATRIWYTTTASAPSSMLAARFSSDLAVWKSSRSVSWYACSAAYSARCGCSRHAFSMSARVRERMEGERPARRAKGRAIRKYSGAFIGSCRSSACDSSERRDAPPL